MYGNFCPPNAASVSWIIEYVNISLGMPLRSELRGWFELFQNIKWYKKSNIKPKKLKIPWNQIIEMLCKKIFEKHMCLYYDFLESLQRIHVNWRNRFSWFMTTKETMDKSIFVASLSGLIGPVLVLIYCEITKRVYIFVMVEVKR